MLRKIGLSVILILMAVSVPIVIPSCSSNSSPTGPNATAQVNNPTNKYNVVFMVYNIGGLGGCGTGTIRKDSANNGFYDQTIYDAQVTLNGTKVDTTLGVYLTTGISVTPGTAYDLSITRGAETIAAGHAVMPSHAGITSPINKNSHLKNTSLPVSWTPVQNATSILFYVDFRDSGEMSGSEDSTLYEPASLQPTETSITIPQTVFAKAGTYFINVNAVYGIPSGLTTVDTIAKGYNISGSAGVFCAINTTTDTVYVDYSGSPKKRNSQTSTQALKEKWIQFIQKWYPFSFQ